MSLNIPTEKPTKAVKENPEATSPSPVPESRIGLELALYKRYTRGTQFFESDKVYLFTVDQARILLAETDPRGLPIWRRYKKRQTILTPEERESQRLQAMTLDNPTALSIQDIAPASRIDIGSDDELRELLGDNHDDAVEI